MTFDRVKEVYEKRWNKIIETVIQNDARPLYIVDPIYFPITESAHVAEADGQAEGTASAGMADQEGQGCTRIKSLTSIMESSNSG